ncbi:G-protein coupled receptor [Drechmeria coniospora]|uniref:G-protein coupled receptor n=1 Tax=Drechmeria coniospora TaxID=98403 RepID=A0A151GXT0_DRECN|nr:G-protein coupled receptor [Drechmeria coniospora]KYK61852.1 G-protein coupled receptor [Drechmeria coniospora]ODA82662.1 hypothetical protein RJ55_01170 [Drechmeria coniospora]
MWPFSSADCDAADGCAAPNPNAMTASTMLSLAPFVACFVVVNLVVVRHLYPKLNAAHDASLDGEGHVLPSHAPAELRLAHDDHGNRSWRRRGVAWTFGATVALAATLALLILTEIIEIVDAKARNLALAVAVPALLVLLVAVVPWLECRALVVGAGWSFRTKSRGRVPTFAWALQLLLFAAWLFAFWFVGKAVPSSAAPTDLRGPNLSETLTRACLERVGVVGIALMAMLAGFASVSSPWHTLTDAAIQRRRPVSDFDVNRKQVGLDSTNEMLSAKRYKLQFLEKRASEPSQQSDGLMGKVLGSLRGMSGVEAEMRALRLEVAGLETMEANLSANLSLMRTRRAAAERASTPVGRLLLMPSYAFSLYCLYRIVATALTTLRRASSPSASFSSTDPVSRFLGLLARHWDPKLDQLAWARTISFALSGVILVASGNSAIQTFHLFAKWTPGLLRHARANLALAVGQLAATYTISSSLLLRSQLPAAAGGAAVGGVLRGALSPNFVDGWFEGWFLAGSALTALGIWVGRKLEGDDWDEYGAEAMGAKRM